MGRSEFTGLSCASSSIGGENYQSMIWEYAVEEVVYDASFPPELFDPHLPWRGGFAMDYIGHPMSIDTMKVALPWP